MGTINYNTWRGMLVTPVDPNRFEFVYQNWVPRSDDVFIASFPKSGTTWTQQIVRLVYSRGLIRDDDPSLHAIIPWLDDSEDLPDLSVVDAMPSPRVFKSHNPYHLLPSRLADANRLIYVTRNAKDTAVSMYFHTFGFWMYEYDEPIEHFIGEFIAGRVEYGPYWTHLRSWYEQRDRPNLLVLHYEAMQDDLKNAVRSVAGFLGQDLTDDEIERVAQASTFGSMKKDPRTSMQMWDEEQRRPGMPFMRKGKVGDWQNHFTSELTKTFDEAFEAKMAGITWPW
ncbi:MAG: sulfotransferase domain-containing protein [Pseudomonadota bacterium]|nr:sulfotransferase domain-containing protein [Pseudomonadota bacterium]